MHRMHAYRRWFPALVGGALLLVGGCAGEPGANGEGKQAAAQGSTLARVQARGTVNCAIHTGQLGMSYLDKRGRWQGLFADYCRALAAAVLGDARKVKFMPVASNKRFTIVQTGEADVLSRTTTWTLTRDTDLGINFVGTMYYDGQSFLVPKRTSVARAEDLDGASICITKGTTAERNTADYFARKGMRFHSVVFENPEEAKLAFFAGRCDAMTTDAFTLTVIRLADADNPDDYVVLPELLTKEPVGPVVRSDDEQWNEINKWVLNALFAAEEMGVTRENAARMRSDSRDPEIRKLLGGLPGFGKSLGLDDDWAFRAIQTTGNYGEMFARHIAPLGVGRGQNRLYRDGGLIYPLPMR
ncbi:amino acid ABC transporter substrate-binding protein [Sphingomonas koreensis]|uniref:Amino acid ABC transporter substrate-binding protein n=2 Tax=Sphingomonas koreensis TaxID=93064 RepID=A0A1L6JBB1_9SPHN|nr:amino acid ABC transporter substrate-binding protein [Sphingomonas koreensis]RSU24670.1 amino acid ABC transporter substrate-binding protein [Sphingomonas koreensis]RSU27061.1 amino acid ABC transporter substrate-binding protein [Sphingomonas koreensis]RSU30010.1 amino acid ABC transporter substrate-binding protein [Sphingomonas koreensis]RSU32896.1 amino acid ABC transporter substrate-binding protein [Sphingomonas koreensis]